MLQIETTAWNLLGIHYEKWATDPTCRIYVHGQGREYYTDAYLSRTRRRVVVARIEAGETIDDRPHVVTRYLHPETKVRIMYGGA